MRRQREDHSERDLIHSDVDFSVTSAFVTAADKYRTLTKAAIIPWSEDIRPYDKHWSTAYLMDNLLLGDVTIYQISYCMMAHRIEVQGIIK